MKKALLAMNLLSVLVLAGCSSTVTTDTLDNSVSYGSYTIKSAGDSYDLELKTTFEKTLSKKLKNYGYKVGEDIAFVYDVKSFDRGNRFGRWYFGPFTALSGLSHNAANTVIQVNVIVQAGNHLGTIDTNSKLYAEFFGGMLTMLLKMQQKILPIKFINQVS